MADTETQVAAGDITTTYCETDSERQLTVERDGQVTTIAQNIDGYAMLKVRTGPDGDELERYYGFDIALDHVAERLGVSVHDIPVPEAADDMGM